MKLLNIVLPLALFLCLMVGCRRAEEVIKEPVVDVEADIAAIENITKQRAQAFNEGNLEDFMSLVADDAVFMPPGFPALIGKEAIHNWQNFDAMNVDATIFTDEIEICGDWAFQRVHWEFSWTQKDSNETTLSKSKEIFIYRRKPDGSWLTSHAIWNGTPIEPGESNN